MGRKCGDCAAGVWGGNRYRHDQLTGGKRQNCSTLNLKRSKSKATESQCRDFICRIEEHSSSYANDCLGSRLVVGRPCQTEPGGEVIPGCLPQRSSAWGEGQRGRVTNVP